MKRIFLLAAALPILALAGCEAKKSENPTSPSVAGPLAGVEITAPRQIEPTQGFKIKESQQPIRLLIENSTSNGVRPVSYSFEVASDSDFQQKVYARGGVPAGEGGRTSVTVDRLDLGRIYYWRVRAEDGANASAYAVTTFETLPKPVLNAPGTVSPVNGATTGSRRPELKITNSDRNIAVGSLRYTFQIATDAAFAGVVASGVRDEGSNTTEYVPEGDLAANAVFYWRANATDGDTTSSWSAVQSFRTAAPAPAPSPGPAPNPGGPCNSSNPETIVQCERAKFGFMNDSQVVQFLTNLVDSLNRNNIPGGRFGLLRKDSGAQCGGYSCDIVCSGNGGGQRQWDVLVDSGGAQGATWHEVFGITVRPCEIR